MILASRGAGTPVEPAGQEVGMLVKMLSRLEEMEDLLRKGSASAAAAGSPLDQGVDPGRASAQPAALLTTAEAIAAELAAAEAARPAVTYSTFAPSNLMPGGGLRQSSRRPGAALKSFRGIAQDLFKS